MTEYDCTTDSYDGVEICFMGSCDGFCVISGEMWVMGSYVFWRNMGYGW